MISIPSYEHPYLDHEDVINIVFTAFLDKTVTNFINSVKNNDPYKKYIVKNDIYSTYANFIENIDTLQILNDFVDTYDQETIIDLVVADNDEQLDCQDIQIDSDDESLPELAKDTYKSLFKSISNKDTMF